MDLAGEYRIPASREAVWDALNDPDILKDCIPGCQSLEKGEEGELAATVVSKIGPVKATFKGEVRLENLNPPESYSIVGEGKGGVAGFAKGGADVKLTEDGDGTVLAYEAKAQVGGKLAQLGSRLIDSTAKKMADDFFGAFSERVGAAAAADAAAEPEAPAEPDAPAAEEAKAADATPEPAASETAPQPAAAPAPSSPAAAAPAASKPAPATPPAKQANAEPEGAGLSFSGPMLWLLVGAAALILILAVAY